MITKLLHPDTQRFLEALREIEQHLRHRDDFWAAAIRKAADEIEKSDAHGLLRFLSFFGGMGSLNDLILCEDGKPLKKENDDLRALLTQAYVMDDSLRREIG